MNSDNLSDVSGEYRIGKINNTDIEFGLHPLHIQMHALIEGGTGFGKSTLIKVLSQQILRQGDVKLWLIDPKEGGDYRFLLKEFSDLLVLRPQILKCNPFCPIPNVPTSILSLWATAALKPHFSMCISQQNTLNDRF